MIKWTKTNNFLFSKLLKIFKKGGCRQKIYNVVYLTKKHNYYIESTRHGFLSEIIK